MHRRPRNGVHELLPRELISKWNSHRGVEYDSDIRLTSFLAFSKASRSSGMNIYALCL
jgi:hypothetical protein